MKIRITDGILFLLGLLFPLGGVLGFISIEKGLIIGGMHSSVLIFSTLAKQFERRIFSGLTYFCFIVGVLALIDEAGILYEGYTAYSPWKFYFMYGGIGAIIAFLFNFKGYAITGALLAYWIPLNANLLFNGKSLDSSGIIHGINHFYAEVVVDPLW